MVRCWFLLFFCGFDATCVLLLGFVLLFVLFRLVVVGVYGLFMVCVCSLFVCCVVGLCLFVCLICRFVVFGLCCCCWFVFVVGFNC